MHLGTGDLIKKYLAYDLRCRCLTLVGGFDLAAADGEIALLNLHEWIP